MFLIGCQLFFIKTDIGFLWPVNVKFIIYLQ
jgi:hypothetical protein